MARKPRTKFQEVGVIGVDAGICWVGDPCYILHKSLQEQYKGIGKDWGEFCGKLNYKKGVTQFNYDLGHPGLGVVVSTGYGDGTYPVYIRRNSEGRISQVMVDFEA